MRSANPLTALPSRGTVVPMVQISAAGQLALWIGRRGRGTAQLDWDRRSLVLHVVSGQVVGVEGDDGDVLSAAFGLTESREWFRQAQVAVETGQVSQGEAAAVVKRALAAALEEFFLAPDSRVVFEVDSEMDPGEFTISFPHLAVEMLLSSSNEQLVEVFLPDPGGVLRRLPDFARRAAALGLTDEGMLILAKINDVRSAREIAEPSPHGHGTVYRLLASAVAAGLAELTPRLEDMPFAAIAEPLPEKRRSRWWLWMTLTLALLAVIAALLLARPSQLGQSAPGGAWAVALDMGCQPADLERLYRRLDRHPEVLRVVPSGGGEDACSWLVWGSFATQDQAAQAAISVPSSFLSQGFPPHVVRVTTQP